MKLTVKPIQFIILCVFISFIFFSCKPKPEKNKLRYTANSHYKIDISHSDGIRFKRELFKSNTFGTYSITSLKTNNSLTRVRNGKDSTAHYNDSKLTGYTLSKYTCKLDSIHETDMNKSSGYQYSFAANGHCEYSILKITEKMDTVPYQINIIYTDTLYLNCPEKLKNDLLSDVINKESPKALKKHIAETIKNLPFKKP
ncbi:hypothetical protein ACE01N_03580 [Saccharicrinis sp. FJH2]|uniref:hypothetical protein n=1 Tax=Saccharicrinis sp. FJH65 TaxID=3344659 RepID=UPI0035F24D67